MLGAVLLLSLFTAPKTVTVGVVADGPWALAPEVLAAFQKEIVDLLAGGAVEIQFPDDKRIVGDWSVAAVKEALDRCYRDPAVNLVLAMGILASNEVGRRPDLPKPTIAPWVIDYELQQIPFTEGKSGKKNLTYLTTPDTVRRDLRIFLDLVPVQRATVLISRGLLEAVPGLAERSRDEAKRANLALEVVGVAGSAEEALRALPADTQAVYVTPLLQLPAPELELLIKGLIARKLPSFSLWGRSEVELGILATAMKAPDYPRRARRTAIAVQQILDGDDPGTLSVLLGREEGLVINMATARAIGFSPRWASLTEAELIHRARSEAERKLSLVGVIQEAIAANLDLLARAAAVRAGEDEVELAISPLLPQLEGSLSGRIIDDDRAGASFGSAPERDLTASLSANQLLFSERAWANLSIQRTLQRAREVDREALELDIVQETAATYLDILRARSGERIQSENLAKTKSNLELARVRSAAGAASQAEVLRWESQLAIDRRAVIEANAGRNATEIALNRLLHRPLEEPFVLEDATLEESKVYAARKRLASYIDNPWGFRVFREFMVKDGIERSPELRQLDLAIAAQDRALASARLAFYLPTVGLRAELARSLTRGGAGSEPTPLPPPLTLPEQDHTTWSIGIVASLPIFLGTSRWAELDRAQIQLEQRKLERSAAAERIEQRIRSALHLSGASYPAIALSNDAAIAARRNLEIVTAGYSRGAVGIVVLLDAQNAALVSERVAADAVYRFLRDQIAVQRAVGWYDFLGDPAEVEGWHRRFLEFHQEQTGK